MTSSQLTLFEMAHELAAGSLTSEQAVETALSAAERFSDLNAIVAFDAENALEQARACDRERRLGRLRGPLHGVPMAHKDMFYRAGRVTGCGSKIAQDFRPSVTAPLLQRLDDAGAIDLGRLHMAEFAMGPTGHNAHLGRCCNPWRLDAITGGSSSGSGAAVAAGIVAGALGSDTGGSVRLPAAFCGVVGLKPTQGRLPSSAMMPLSESLDTAGPLARSSRCVARLMSVLTDGEEDFERNLDGDLEGTVIGVPTNYYLDSLDPEIAHAFAEARLRLIELGASILDVDLPEPDTHAGMAALVWAPEAAAVHLRWLQERPQDYGEQVRNRLLHGLSMPATAYIRARQTRSRDVAAMLEGPFARCSILLTPTTRVRTPLANDVAVSGGPVMDRMIGDLSALTRPISYLGLPALSTPMGFCRRGLPMGLQLIGRPRREHDLLRVAAAYEGVTDWLRRRPMPPTVGAT